MTAVRPSVGVNENPKQPAVLLVGVDVSESMTVKDELGGQARIDAVRKSLEKCQPIFDELLTEQKVSEMMVSWLQSLRSESKVSIPGITESPGEGVQSR